MLGFLIPPKKLEVSAIGTKKCLKEKDKFLMIQMSNILCNLLDIFRLIFLQHAKHKTHYRILIA